ncbi:TBC1 domain family member 22B-like isoform X2 [Ptychodera flava]|uniref:TBC1 domain family member 22B-like isoform X2 n=1 Tax=Ptychodera flava TaxID=63121 RepID=UPI00396A6FF6
MAALGLNSDTKKSKKTFWKRTSDKVPGSIKPVYGAKHPPTEAVIQASIGNIDQSKNRSRRADSFADFDNSTLDAWDDTDDELMLQKTRQLSVEEDVSSSTSRQKQDISSTNSGSVVAQAKAIDINSSALYQGNVGGPGVGIRQTVIRESPKPVPPAMKLSNIPVPDREAAKLQKFGQLLSGPMTDLEELRKISWSGIPPSVRSTTWKILLGYLPSNIDRRSLTLERKRAEYFSFIDQYYETRHEPIHRDTYRQIHIDIPRTNPLMPLFHQPEVHEIFERILYIWAIRHPASGYVQGMNDLVTPFFVVFLSEFVDDTAEAIDNYNVKKLEEEKLSFIEADSFWCMSKLLDGIQDNYTFAQPGIQLKVNALRELVQRVDASLHGHFGRHNVEYLQFAFRWMNNLLMREIPLKCTIRLWDTYMSEGDGFANFHLYVCAAMLVQFSENIKRKKDFHGILLFLQNLPTKDWNNEQIGVLVAEAYRWKFMFADAPNHLSTLKK